MKRFVRHFFLWFFFKNMIKIIQLTEVNHVFVHKPVNIILKTILNHKYICFMFAIELKQRQMKFRINIL